MVAEGASGARGNTPSARAAKAVHSRETGRGGAPSVDALAAAALAVLVARSPVTSDDKFAARIESFCDALVHSDPVRARLYASRLIAIGVTSEQIYERYIPAAARRLGEHWVEDFLGFADVSVGATRLQELARELEGRFVEGGVTIPLGHNALIAIPSFEQHTLGAFIAASQLRKLGLWVQVSVSSDPNDLMALAASQRFTGIGFSAASQRSLDPLRNLVEKFRNTCDFAGPIVIGGAICCLGSDVASYTGADVATSDPKEFADLCGAKSGVRLLEYDDLLLNK